VRVSSGQESGPVTSGRPTGPTTDTANAPVTAAAGGSAPSGKRKFISLTPVASKKPGERAAGQNSRVKQQANVGLSRSSWMR
jgi:hypothetical protein